MIQVYSDGLTIAAGATIPLNNVTYFKGKSAVHTAPASVALNQRGVYMIHVDAYGTPADAGNFGVQLAVNGIPRLDGISEETVAVGDYGACSFTCLVTVAQTDCPCNCTSAPTNLTLVNPSDVGANDGHYNMLVTKLC